MIAHRILALSVLSLVVSALHAAATLEGFSAGSHVNGPVFDASELKGRVVLIDFWGVQCGPCLANIPHLVELQAKYGRDQLIIIANQGQEFDDDITRATWKSHGGSDLPTVTNHGNLPGSNVSHVPHVFLFSHEGKLLFEGDPSGLDAQIASAIKASPGFLVADRAYLKVGKQAAVIGALKSNLGPVLKSLRTLLKNEDVATKEEAEFLLGRVSTYAEQSLGKITTQRNTNPVQACEILGRMVSLFGGDELGKPFESLMKELKADKTFQNELNAIAVLSDIKTKADKIGLNTQPEDAKRNRLVMSQIADSLHMLVSKYPDSKAAAEAAALAKRWGI
jgi:thiol-disulfide isomerase/thioredoxin